MQPSGPYRMSTVVYSRHYDANWSFFLILSWCLPLLTVIVNRRLLLLTKPVWLLEFRIGLKEVSPAICLRQDTVTIIHKQYLDFSLERSSLQKWCFSILWPGDAWARCRTRVVGFTFPCRSTKIGEFRLWYGCRKDLLSITGGSKSNVITRPLFLCIDGQKMQNSANTRCWTKILKLLSLGTGDKWEEHFTIYWMSQLLNFRVFKLWYF